MEIGLYIEFIQLFLKCLCGLLVACVPAVIQRRLMAVFGMNNCKNAGRIALVVINISGIQTAAICRAENIDVCSS